MEIKLKIAVHLVESSLWEAANLDITVNFLLVTPLASFKCILAKTGSRKICSYLHKILFISMNWLQSYELLCCGLINQIKNVFSQRNSQEKC